MLKGQATSHACWHWVSMELEGKMRLVGLGAGKPQVMCQHAGIGLLCNWKVR